MTACLGRCNADEIQILHILTNALYTKKHDHARKICLEI